MIVENIEGVSVLTPYEGKILKCDNTYSSEVWLGCNGNISYWIEVDVIELLEYEKDIYPITHEDGKCLNLK